MAVKNYKKGNKTLISKNFVLKEFDCKGGACCSGTKIDSKLISYLQQIRDHFNKSVVINSAYRCKKHNDEVFGAKNSRHLKGQAADITVKNVAPLKVAQYAEKIGIKGIGLYDGFVHIDTRSSKSFWYSANEFYRSTFGGKNPYSEPVNNVKLGSFGNGVKWVQFELKSAGYTVGEIDGICGNITVDAIKKFQKDKGLEVDGICGKKTRKALKSA